MSLLANHALINPGAVALDVDYQAVLARGTSLGFSLPSPTQQGKQNQLVLDLKSAGIWSNLDDLLVLACNGDQNFSLLNFVSPSTLQGTLVLSPVFTTNLGWKNNGLNNGIDTGFIPSNGVKYTLNVGSWFFYIDNNTSTLTGNGVNVTGRVSYCMPFSTGSNSRVGVNSSAISDITTGASATDNKGFWHIQRTSSTNVNVFRNGSLVANVSISAGPINSTRSFWLGMVNNNGAASNRLDANVNTSVFGVGDALVGKELALYNAWNNYFTSI